MILASFDTMAYHLFEMKFKGTTYFLTEEDFEDLPNYDNERYDLFGVHKIGTLGLNVGDTIQMTYDLGCCQVFNIELLEINDMLRGHGTAYPKILDGAGRGIVDDMPAFELLEAIRKTDENGHSEIYYSSSCSDNAPEWDYRNYRVDWDNTLLKGIIDRIRDGYENYEE